MEGMMEADVKEASAGSAVGSGAPQIADKKTKALYIKGTVGKGKGQGA